MKKVNYGSKYAHKLTVRLTDEQMNFVNECSDIIGCTPSDYVRMTINACMVNARKGATKIETNENK